MANNMRTGENKTFVLHLDECAGALLTSRLNDGYSALPFGKNTERVNETFRWNLPPHLQAKFEGSRTRLSIAMGVPSCSIKSRNK